MLRNDTVFYHAPSELKFVYSSTPSPAHVQHRHMLRLGYKGIVLLRSLNDTVHDNKAPKEHDAFVAQPKREWFLRYASMLRALWACGKTTRN